MALTLSQLVSALTTIFGTNQTTCTHVATVDSNGNPTGKITTANLLSLLLSPNKNEFNDLGKDIDATDIPFGFYQLQSYETANPSKLPYTPSTVNRGILLNFDSFSGGKRGQVIFSLGEGKIYARYYRSSSNPWNAWKSITLT